MGGVPLWEVSPYGRGPPYKRCSLMGGVPLIRGVPLWEVSPYGRGPLMGGVPLIRGVPLGEVSPL